MQENRRLFDLFNKAIFVLCLDQRTSHEIYGTPEGGNDAEQNLDLWAGQMLHGGGSSFNRSADSPIGPYIVSAYLVVL